MRQHIKLFSGVALFFALLLAGCTGMLGDQSGMTSRLLAQESSEETRTVQVSGVGEAQVEPDTAVINLGVETQEETAQAALQENNTQMQALVEALREAGMSSQNIQTQTIRLIPRYEFNETNDNGTLIGYTASNIVEVRTSDLDSLGTLLDQAVEAGANTIEGIRFELSDPEEAIDQVRETAVENARHKAEQLAEITGATLGPILRIQESSNTPGPIMQRFEV